MNDESIPQQNAAWMAVCDTLSELMPGWLQQPGTGLENAVAAIRKLAARDAQYAAMKGQEPVGYMSAEQLPLIKDRDGEEGGHYIPMRKSPAGLFTLALYTHHAPTNPAAQERAEPVAPAVQPTVPSSCDGKEQDAFEAWAAGERFDMSVHPLHWLFLNEKTYAARQGWKGALKYVGSVLSATPPAPAQPEAIDWILAMGHALGLDSGHHIPIVPSVEEFKRLFAEIERRAVAAQPSPEPSKPEQAEAPSDKGTPGPWFVRKLARDGELKDCFVAAPDMQGLAYDAEILGDDEYREGIERKLADCELIVSAVNAVRATLPPAIAAGGSGAGERETFEAYIAKDCGDLSTFGVDPNRHYKNSGVNHEWMGWQARAALATKPQAEQEAAAEGSRNGSSWNQRAAVQAAQPEAVGDGATIAGLESAVGHLSTMVDEQRRLLVEVEQVCGRDAYGMEFEDGDSELIDKVRAHLAATTSAPTPEPMSAPTEAKPAQPCGHPESLLLKSAETGEPLYCEACDDKSGRRDAEQRETELLAANQALREKIAALSKPAQDAVDAEQFDWARVSVLDAVEFRREAYDLTQSEWASLLGMAQSHYSEFVNGKRELPKKAMAVAFEYGVPACALFQCKPDKGIDDIRAAISAKKGG